MARVLKTSTTLKCVISAERFTLAFASVKMLTLFAASALVAAALGRIEASTILAAAAVASAVLHRARENIARDMAIRSAGAKGEEAVASVLARKLPDSYVVINDVVLSKGNIDHVVVGPNGVFCIETKRYGGKLSTYGSAWLQVKRGREKMIKPPYKQVMDAVHEIKKLIKECSGEIADEVGSTRSKIKSVPVVPIIAIVNKEDNVRLQHRFIKIVPISRLPETIMGFRGKVTLNVKEVDAIARHILRYGSRRGNSLKLFLKLLSRSFKS